MIVKAGLCACIILRKLKNNKQMTKVLKICCSEWRNASRDKRELSLCKELGMEVLVLAKGEEGKIDDVDGFEVHRKGSRPLGTKYPNSINRVWSVFKWAKEARALKPNIISGHDIDGLLVGYISTLFKKKKPKLIYDSHEYELGRNKKRSVIQLKIIKLIEGYLMRRCAFSIMVNDNIADLVQQIHHLKDRPIVIRSTPNYWNIDKSVTDSIHAEYCKALGISLDSFFVMYHGGLLKDRGIETLIKVVSQDPQIYGVILGNGQPEYVTSLHELADNLGVKDRILFKAAVPIEELWKYVGAADLGLIMIPAHCENHRLSLPNKFFENIQAETPLVCPDYPAMRKIIEQYDNGIVCDVTNVDNVKTSIERLRCNDELLNHKKNGAKIAKKELCWEKEQVDLRKCYKMLIGGVELLSDVTQ